MSVFEKKYTVDYSGQKACYPNARDSYREGEKVTLYYPFVATDTDYSFSLEGAALAVDYEHSKGYILRFVMPEHDVVLHCSWRNSMIREVHI